MVDYTTNDQMMRLTKYRNAQSLVLVGIVLWEIIITLPFDWSIVLGRRRARWPMLPYVIARASMIFHVLALTINSHGREIIPCDTQIWILKITNATGIWASSLLLALRSIALWSWDKRVVAFITVLYAGLIVVYCLTWQKSITMFNGLGCVLLKSAPYSILLIEFTYTMVFDFLVTLLVVVKLWAWRKQGGLSQMMLEKGISYFIIASCGNLVQAVLAALHLSSLLNVLFLPVAMCISVIASTRVFIRLQIDADPHDTYTYQTNNTHSPGTALTLGHCQSSHLGQQSHLPPLSTTPNSNMFPLAPGFDQPYAFNNSRDTHHRITIQTQAVMVGAKNAGPDLEYGRKRQSEDGGSFNYNVGPARQALVNE